MLDVIAKLRTSFTDVVFLCLHSLPSWLIEKEKKNAAEKTN